MKKFSRRIQVVLATQKEIAAYNTRCVRFSGHDGDLEKVSDIKSERELEGYDGSIFG